jgi:esterase/lipase superfamily enzyme
MQNCAAFINATAKVSRSKRVMFLFHGTGNTFLNAIRLGVGLAQESNYDGVMVVWCWPSEGWATDYIFDTESARWSQSHASEFFKKLSGSFPELRVDAFAHSLGNRILLYTLSQNVTNDNLNSIIFAAPDEAQDIFIDELHQLEAVGKLKTLYASDRDDALWLSGFLNSPHVHGRRVFRAGDAGEEILVLPGLETVDATALSTGLIGHSYVFQHPRAANDIDQILNQGKKADQRGLEEHQKAGRPFWVILP